MTTNPRMTKLGVISAEKILPTVGIVKKDKAGTMKAARMKITHLMTTKMIWPYMHPHRGGPLRVTIILGNRRYNYRYDRRRRRENMWRYNLEVFRAFQNAQAYRALEEGIPHNPHVEPPEASSLGIWMLRQRARFRASASGRGEGITLDHYRALNEIGFPFIHHEAPNTPPANDHITTKNKDAILVYSKRKGPSTPEKPKAKSTDDTTRREHNPSSNQKAKPKKIEDKRSGPSHAKAVPSPTDSLKTQYSAMETDPQPRAGVAPTTNEVVLDDDTYGSDAYSHDQNP
jgi:hypothetical protein